jgi:hypothetical protein
MTNTLYVVAEKAIKKPSLAMALYLAGYVDEHLCEFLQMEAAYSEGGFCGKDNIIYDVISIAEASIGYVGEPTDEHAFYKIDAFVIYKALLDAHEKLLK